MPSVSVASFNVLADAYIDPRFYPGTPASLLDPAVRRPALVRRVVGLGADVTCLQELDRPTLDALRASFEPQGADLAFVQRPGRPDGCAVIVRAGIAVRHEEIVRFVEGAGVALLLVIEHGDRPLGVATTHLKWDPPRTARDEQLGYRQAIELLAVLDGLRPSCASWIVCGDFNATAGSDVVGAMLEAGLRDLYAGRPDAHTCNSNGKAKRIDYLFHTTDLRARPGDVPAIDDRTPLPGPDEPSDHLPIVGWFELSPSNIST